MIHVPLLKRSLVQVSIGIFSKLPDREKRKLPAILMENNSVLICGALLVPSYRVLLQTSQVYLSLNFLRQNFIICLANETFLSNTVISFHFP